MKKVKKHKSAKLIHQKAQLEGDLVGDGAIELVQETTKVKEHTGKSTKEYDGGPSKRKKSRIELKKPVQENVQELVTETLKDGEHPSNKSMEDDDQGLSISKKKKKKSKVELKKLEDDDKSEASNPKSRPEILSSLTFDTLKDKVCNETLNAINDMGFTTLTQIQARTIPHLLLGRDLVGGAKTGSGKTLAFLIPAIELMHKAKFTLEDGSGAVIICPTRELSMQTFNVLTELLKYHPYTYGVVMGGTSKYPERKHLAGGVNILVATPGRLLDHLQNARGFRYENLKCLVIDEADKILDSGFEEAMTQILKFLPKRRQTILFSATQSEKTKALTSLAFDEPPVYIGVDDNKDEATVSGLDQQYVICGLHKRLRFLHKFLRCHRDKKLMVFFGACMSVEFHSVIFGLLNLKVIAIHGKQDQDTRLNNFFEFCNSQSGALFCTDIASRGLDIPAVDWILQYDAPDDPKEYIHRVGRTARGEGSKGKALLLLTPEEEEYVEHLKEAKVNLRKINPNWEKFPDTEVQVQALVTEDKELRSLAKQAYVGYSRAYCTHRLMNVFNIHKMDFKRVALSFGFTSIPRVDLNLAIKKPDRETRNWQKRNRKRRCSDD